MWTRREPPHTIIALGSRAWSLHAALRQPPLPVEGALRVNRSPLVWHGFQLEHCCPSFPPHPIPAPHFLLVPRRRGWNQPSSQWPSIHCSHFLSWDPVCPQEGGSATASVSCPREGVSRCVLAFRSGSWIVRSRSSSSWWGRELFSVLPATHVVTVSIFHFKSKQMDWGFFLCVFCF